MTQEDYLVCSRYEGKNAHPTEAGFTAFKDDETGLNYFALLDEDGKVLLKSEGYPQEASRENGVQSVIKNRTNPEFYSLKEEEGNYYWSLRAGNYKEIARSCQFESESAAQADLKFIDGTTTRSAVRAAEAAALAAAAAAANAASGREDDDYLACKEYEGHPNVGAEVPHFVKFQSAKDGQYYFAWLFDNGDVKMRSEGYPTTAARDNGFESVQKNRDLTERYRIIEKLSYHFVSLRAGNHQEIARSCSYKDINALYAAYPIMAPGYDGSGIVVKPIEVTPEVKIEETKLDGTLAAAGLAAAATVVPSVELPKVEQKAHTHVDAGAAALAAAAAATAAAAANAKKVVVETPKAHVPPPVVETATAFTEEAAGGFKWWWILLPLLLLAAAFLLWRSCNTETVAVAPTVVAPIPVDTPKPIATPTPQAAMEKAPVSTDPKVEWIFFDFDKSNVRPDAAGRLDNLVAVMKNHADYKCLLSAHTDGRGSAAYNEALSKRRSAEALAYLVSKGIDKSRIKTVFKGMADPVAKNTVDGKDSEEGRQFNRRVEVMIMDAKGEKVDIVQKDLPPAPLKAK